MCEPATIAAAALAVSVLSTGASVYAQSEQASAQNKAADAQYKNTVTAYNENLSQIQLQRNQAAENTAEQEMKNNAQSRSLQATANTSAGESGVAGNSVSALLRDLAGKAGMDNTDVEAQYARENQTLNAQQESLYNGVQSSVNGIQKSPGVNWAGAGLQLAQAGLSYAGTTSRIDAANKAAATGKPTTSRY